MSDEDRQQDETPAPSPLDLPLGGHALADYMLQRGILQHTLEENERLRAEAEAERRARQKQGQPFSSPRFDTAAEAEAYLEQQRKAHESIQRIGIKLENLQSILDQPPGAPEKGATVDAWLDWRAKEKRRGNWYRLEQIAKWSGHTIAQLKYKSSLRKPRGTPKTDMKKRKKLKG